MNELLRLIALKQEGGYWDFKKQWYDKEKICDLLHDIICMANNLENKDGLIIIGIDEENDYDIVDVSNDENRRNTQQIVDFLKDKKFAGDIRPTVKVEQVDIFGKVVDVIVVKNDNSTPYFLKENYRTLVAHHIYTRVQDTNTPKNASADIDKVELLWKKRLGLLATTVEKLEVFITRPKDWSDSPCSETKKFHNVYPEYTITRQVAEDRNGYEYYLFSQDDSTPYWRQITIKYHQTVLASLLGVALDGGRYFTPCPCFESIRIETPTLQNVPIRYMIMNSFIYNLNLFFYKHEFSEEARASRDRFLGVILLFETEDEKNEFKNYVGNNWQKRDSYLEEIPPYILENIPQIKGYKENYFREQYENALILKKMLNEYRAKLC